MFVLRVKFHDVHKRGGAVVHVQKLPERGTGAPKHNFGLIGDLGIMHFADDRR